MNWRNIVFSVIALLIGIVFHEYAHARMAVWRGDLTPKNAGRLTLNPVPHIDPFGTILLPLLLIIMSWGHAPILFGWAKPVPVNPFFMKRPNDMRLVSIAGPLMNLIVAGVAFTIGLLLKPLLIKSGRYTDLLILLFFIVYINIILCIFNLLPVPPLDGSHILESFLPYKARLSFQRISRYGFIVGIIAILFLFEFIIRPFLPFFNTIQRLMLF